MKNVFAVLLVVSFMCSTAFCFTDSSNTSARIMDCDSLQRQLNLINAKLDRIMVELSNGGFQPKIQSETKTWGNGWAIGGEITTEMVGLEGGYTYKTANSFFLGSYLGVQGQHHGGDGPHALAYLKLMTATPIFFNNLSLQLNMIPTAYFNDDPFFGGKNSWFGFGVNPQVAVWLGPKSCLTLGIQGTLSDRLEVTEANALKGTFTWYELKVGYTFIIKKI